MAEGQEAVDFTNQVARNQEFGLLTLHTMAKVHMLLQFQEGDGLSKEVWVRRE
jgi:hypothetical protein